MLLAAGVLVPCSASGVAHEDDGHLRDWSLHEALFHARSRWGLRAAPVSVLSPRTTGLPPAARAAERAADLVPLATPTSVLDVPLGVALTKRRSLRRHAEPPVTLEALGALLHWSARVQRILPASGESQPYEATLRPYPSGGACHPLVIYACVARCDGLDPGLYRYDPFAHVLERLRGRERAAAALLGAHPDIDDVHGPRQLLLVIAARFARTNRRYREIPYALVLKEAGALLQNLYLVAGALGLAPCALGGGDAVALAAAVGSDVWEESSVAELSVGAGG
jgi:SagB-type dehydrogenase family enzyme